MQTQLKSSLACDAVALKLNAVYVIKTCWPKKNVNICIVYQTVIPNGTKFQL